MKFYLIYILILFSVILPSDMESKTGYKNSAGLKASNISGYGLYYSRKLGQDFRLQLMGVAYYYERTKSEDTRTIINYDIGIELHRYVYKTGSTGVFWLAGGYYYNDDDTDDGPDLKTQSITNSYNIGTGLGVEFYHGHFIYNFDIGYKFFEDDIDTFKNGDFSYNELKRVTKIGAGIGTGFLF